MLTFLVSKEKILNFINKRIDNTFISPVIEHESDLYEWLLFSIRTFFFSEIGTNDLIVTLEENDTVKICATEQVFSAIVYQL